MNWRFIGSTTNKVEPIQFDINRLSSASSFSAAGRPGNRSQDSKRHTNNSFAKSKSSPKLLTHTSSG